MNTAVWLSYLPISRQKNGVRLNVSMYDAIAMKEGKRLQASLAHSRNLLFIHSETQHSQLYSSFIIQTRKTEKSAFVQAD